MSTHTYVVKGLGIGSLARWGFAVGALVACLPAFMCSLIAFAVSRSVHRIVEGWQDVGVTFIGQRLSLNMVDLLHLGQFLNVLRALDALGVFGILLLGMLLVALLGLLFALSFARAAASGVSAEHQMGRSQPKYCRYFCPGRIPAA